MPTENRKTYLKTYVRKPANRKRHAEVVREIYHTPEGKAYARKADRYPRSRFTRAKRVAKRRGLTWTIEEKDYIKLISRLCYYCDRNTSQETGCGLDRIDNNRGYELDNVNPACGQCNRLRGRTMDAEEFKRQNKLNKRTRGDA